MLELTTDLAVRDTLNLKPSTVLSILIVFGFISNQALKTARPSNAGLRDQRAAFECEQPRKDLQIPSADLSDVSRGS